MDFLLLVRREASWEADEVVLFARLAPALEGEWDLRLRLLDELLAMERLSASSSSVLLLACEPVLAVRL